MKSRWLILIGLALASLFSAQAAQSKLAPELRGAQHSNKPIPVIIQWKRVPSAKQADKVEKHLGTVQRTMKAAMASLASIPPGQLDKLSDDPDVDYISPDRKVSPRLDYAIQTVGADIAFRSGWTGKGVGVAVIDSGIAVVDDLALPGSTKRNPASRIVYAEDFVGNGKGSTSDPYGHGTHVAGIIGGSGVTAASAGNKAVVQGVAPGVNLLSFRVLDEEGVGRDSDVIQAIERVIELKNQYNVRIINLSLGRPVMESYTVDPLCKAVEAAADAGILVVVAAGNEGRNNSAGTNGYGTIGSPGNHPLALTVGAMKTMSTGNRSDDLIASYSSKGPTRIDHIVKPDIVAPGNKVISLSSGKKSHLSKNYPQISVPVSYYLNNNGKATSDEFMWLSGTSMAAPMVSGAAALMFEKEPSLTSDQAKARLMKTATKEFPPASTTTDPSTGVAYTSEYDIFTIGAGYLDIASALSNYELTSGRAVSPSAEIVEAKVVLCIPQGAPWSANPVWGDIAGWRLNAVWGDKVFLNGANAVWEDNAVWGDRYNAVWGDRYNAVWGDRYNAVWGDSVSAMNSLMILLYGEK